MFESILGSWTDKCLIIGGEAVHISDCFHVACDRNLFWANRNSSRTITCLKANYLHISLRLHPTFFRLLEEKILIYSNTQLTGKFKTVVKEASGIRLEQVTDLTRRSRTETPNEIIFSTDTINKHKLSIHKLKPEDLQIKYKRIKLAIRDRKKDLVNLTLSIYAETRKGWVQVGEWISKDIAVRFGNVADHPDLKGMTAKDREREFSDMLYAEISQFQKYTLLQLQKAVYSPVDELWNDFLKFA
ncbi:hypothetical protein HK103_002926 [Boothiomyces macroporosus]|uniref:Uncharacterized protein n=1 Tax=Boothiomyces macroporosus TaxID=261099 RepID=A0AAD5U968_9FUNG|nr:hypothetical protein HK103_002926 [Boothiomyces macroporosus]